MLESSSWIQHTFHLNQQVLTKAIRRLQWEYVCMCSVYPRAHGGCKACVWAWALSWQQVMLPLILLSVICKIPHCSNQNLHWKDYGPSEGTVKRCCLSLQFRLVWWGHQALKGATFWPGCVLAPHAHTVSFLSLPSWSHVVNMKPDHVFLFLFMFFIWINTRCGFFLGSDGVVVWDHREPATESFCCWNMSGSKRAFLSGC